MGSGSSQGLRILLAAKQPISVASVTTSDGSPTRATKNPFRNPPKSPTPRHKRQATAAGTPASPTIVAKAQADSPIIEPTT